MATANNPYDRLVWLLKKRLARQNEAIGDTQKELEGAEAVQAKWNADQLELFKQAGGTVVDSRSRK